MEVIKGFQSKLAKRDVVIEGRDAIIVERDQVMIEKDVIVCRVERVV